VTYAIARAAHNDRKAVRAGSPTRTLGGSAQHWPLIQCTTAASETPWALCGERAVAYTDILRREGRRTVRVTISCPTRIHEKIMCIWKTKTCTRMIHQNTPQHKYSKASPSTMYNNITSRLPLLRALYIPRPATNAFHVECGLSDRPSRPGASASSPCASPLCASGGNAASPPAGP
jgi:hypothetical protein